MGPPIVIQLLHINFSIDFGRCRKGVTDLDTQTVDFGFIAENRRQKSVPPRVTVLSSSTVLLSYP